jgi:hypothetical protein
MTITELQSKYSWEELSSMPGDPKLRYELFAPFLNNLHENKIIYQEHFIGIVKLEDLIITPERFEAKAIPYLLFEGCSMSDKYFFKQEHWTFGAKWSFVRLLDDGFGTYGGWKIWCDPETIKKAEELTLNKKFKEAYGLLQQ